MNTVQIFENSKFGKVRTLTEDGKTLFCGSDVAKALGYKNPNDALARHCKGIVKRDTPTASGVQSMNFIPEGDIYRLAAKSELPGADEFEHWIFDIVLPSIRKNGGYIMGQEELLAQRGDRLRRGPGLNNDLLKVFEHPELGRLRMVLLDCEPWFVGKDAVLAVGYRSTKNVLQGHVRSANRLQTNPLIELAPSNSVLNRCGPDVLDLLYQMWWPTMVNEAGLFDLLQSSRKPHVAEFERWLREEVLPAVHSGAVLPAPCPAPTLLPVQASSQTPAEDVCADLTRRVEVLEAYITDIVNLSVRLGQPGRASKGADMPKDAQIEAIAQMLERATIQGVKSTFDFVVRYVR